MHSVKAAAQLCKLSFTGRAHRPKSPATVRSKERIREGGRKKTHKRPDNNRIFLCIDVSGLLRGKTMPLSIGLTTPHRYHVQDDLTEIYGFIFASDCNI